MSNLHDSAPVHSTDTLDSGTHIPQSVLRHGTFSGCARVLLSHPGAVQLDQLPRVGECKKETGVGIGRFIFESLLCRWGGIETIVTDNGVLIVAGLDWLSRTYHINHIRISPYNKQANGIVKHSHHTIHESIVKTCEGDMYRWLTVSPFAFWED